ncbi:MAG TPA: hypothetical protein VFE51_03035 [Verrucomicrobiae bacterium]|nr:hypothetical protein [Verrucomicrobiae bacterium]
MKLRIATKLAVVGACAALLPRSLLACAACYGQSDSAMAAGMNWGILSLLGMIVFVLGGVAGFFVFLIRRSTASTPRTEAALAESWDANWPVAAESAADFSDEPLPRCGIKRESALAQRRKGCAHSQTSPLPLATRGRS